MAQLIPVLVSSLDLGTKLAEQYLADVGTLEQVAERRGRHGEFHEAPVNLLLIDSVISSKLTVPGIGFAAGCARADAREGQYAVPTLHDPAW
jgi:hypothetical protein